MTYIELINEFWSKNLSLVRPLSSAEVEFYFYLLKECNLQEWKNPFRLPTRKIVMEIDFRKDTITDVRNSLQQKGFIKFKKGNRRAEEPEYTLLDRNGNLVQNTYQNPYQNPYQSVYQNPYQNVPPTPPIEKTKDLDLKEKPSKEGKKKVFQSLFGDSEKNYDGYNLDYVDDKLLPIFTEWLEYKKKRRERYKDDVQVKKCYKHLCDLSESRADYAQAIIDSSIANGYQGFFALKAYEKERIIKSNEHENNTTRDKDRRGTSVDEYIQNMDHKEEF